VTQPDEKHSTQNPTAHPATGQGLSPDQASAPYSGPPPSQGYPRQEALPTSYGYDGQSQYQAPTSYGHEAPPTGYGQEVPPPGYAPAQHGYAPNPGYPGPYGYPQYGYQLQQGPVRPGAATASAVLMFIQAAVTLISTFYVLFFASLAGSASAAGVSEADSYESEFTIIGILQLISVGLLIFGGVQLLGGSANGRVLTIVACGVQLAFVLYWMIRIGSLPEFDTEGFAFFFVVPLMYAVLPLVALPLALGRPVTDYLAAKRGARSSAP